MIVTLQEQKHNHSTNISHCFGTPSTRYSNLHYRIKEIQIINYKFAHSINRAKFIFLRWKMNRTIKIVRLWNLNLDKIGKLNL